MPTPPTNAEQQTTVNPWRRAYWDLSVRARGEEWMDAPDVDVAMLERALKGLAVANRFAGGVRPLTRFLSRLPMVADASPEAPAELSLLDLATGAADVPRAMDRWAWRQREPVAIRTIGLDIHPETLAIAARWPEALPTSRIQLVRGDAFALPLADRSVDVVHASLFLHHFASDEVRLLLAEIARVARLGVVLNDLIRSHASLATLTAVTTIAPAMFRHDGRLSVRRGWRRGEIEQLCDEAGLGFLRWRRLGIARFAMTGIRPAGNGRCLAPPPQGAPPQAGERS